MRANAAHGITATAWGHDDRVQLRIGVNRYTATAEEATELAGQILAAVKALREAGGDATQ